MPTPTPTASPSPPPPPSPSPSSESSPPVEPLPSVQHRYPDLPRLDEAEVHRRRETLFLVFSGIFLGTLAMLNILGISRFIKLAEIDFDGDDATAATVFAVAVGVLPYPITFLCTDFLSELYGKARASRVVWVGFVLNLWVVAVLWIGGALPGMEPTDPATGELVRDAAGRLPVFFEVRELAFGAIAASMIAYLIAQLVDVHVFHFWKRLTRGKHLWIRNNASTLVSQLVDTTAVILVTHFYASALFLDPDRGLWPQLLLYIATGYAFKAIVAAVDTLPFVALAPRVARYLRLPPPHLPDPGPALAVEAGVG